MNRGFPRTVGLAAILVLAGCARGRDAGPGGAADESAAARVREHYTSEDEVAAAAYTWTSPTGIVFVLVDVESGMSGVVQSRADLWAVADSEPARIGRSDVMPSAASIGAFAFEDVTGDGIPDLLGYVADSGGVSFPVFLAGAHGMMPDQIETAAPGFRLSAEPEQAPKVYAGPRGACALQVWAEEPAPDSLPAGWRYMPLLKDGQLGRPGATPPSC